MNPNHMRPSLNRTAADETLLRTYSLIALAALGVLFLLGIVFYKYRLFFADASFIPFTIIRYKLFTMQEHRYGSFITQMVPYFGSRWHLPIKFIMKCYAFSFNLFYLIAGVIVYRCRQYSLLIVMALYYFLIASDTFYWTNNEIHQAIAWMFLFFAVTLRMGQLGVKIYFVIPVFLFLGFLTIYTHFIVLIPTVFLWLFLWIRQDEWPWSKGATGILSLCLCLIVSSKFLVVDPGSYDQAHLHNALHLGLSDFSNAVTAPVVRKFILRCATNYWVGVAIFVLGMGSLVRNRKMMLVTWCLASFAGYIVLMGVTYVDLPGDALLLHVESEWESLGIIMATPFVFAALPLARRNAGVIIVSFVFLVRLVYICSSSEKFAWRYDFLRSVMEQMERRGITKLGLTPNEDLKKRCMLVWGLPDESIMWSAMNGDVPQRNFGFVDTGDKDLMRQLAEPKIVYASFELVTPVKWNFRYFTPDTLHPYTIMNYENLMKSTERIDK